MAQPALTTERLTLRPFRPGDDDLAHRIRVDPRVTWWREALMGLTRPTPEESRDWLEAVLPFGERGLGGWLAFLRDRPERADSLAGYLFLLPIGRTGPETELAYHFLPERWGRGYATEAARAVLDYGF